MVARGIVRVRAARFRDAEGDFAAAVRFDPDHLAARVNWGQVLVRLGRTDEAIAQLDRAIQLAPGEGKLYRARALARLDRQAPAPGSAGPLAIADFDAAIRLGRAGSPDRADDFAGRARLHFRAREFSAALADANEAIRIKPDLFDATLVRIQAFLELKRYSEVLGACDEALARRPDAAEFWELRGLACSDRQDFVAAIGDLTRALTIDPKRLSARMLRGWAYLVSDAAKLALADFDAVVEQAPDNAEAYGGRGFALALGGQYRAATADAEESLRKTSQGDSRILYNAARIYARAAEAVASSSVAKRPMGSTALIETYRERALSLLQSAVERLPRERRQSFYRDVIQSDPALAAVRQSPQFARLAGQVGRPAQ